MKVASSILLAALIACAAAHEGHDHADEEAPEVDSDVVVLTKDTFAAFAEKPLSLIEFYAPWCGHCKALAPEYEEAATQLKGEVPIAKVDCTVETDVCSEQGVQGYPTLKVFKNGAATDFKGQRKAASIISYMKKQSLPAVSVLEGDKVDEFSASDKVVVIGFFKDTESAEYKAFAAVADRLREDFVFGTTSDKAAAKKHGASFPDVVLFKTFDEGKADFDEKITEEALTTFIKTNSVPTIDDIGPENYSSYVEAGLPIAYLFISTPEERKTAGAIVEPLAKEYKGKLSFVYIDAVKYGGHGRNLNLKESWPAFVIQDAKAGLKFVFDQDKEITTKDLTAFLTDFVADKVEPSLKSEAVPETNDADVKVVVGKNYEEIVLDTEKDVLLEFYAPWCGHCKKLAPIYEELGALVKDIKGITIAKMDATENDIPPKSGFQIEGFPTIKLFKAGSNEIVEYNGDRSLEDLAQFLKDNASNGATIEVPAKPEPVEEAAEAAEGHDEL